MFSKITPEQAGISSDDVLDFFKTMDDYGFSTHSIIMAKDNNIFCECYFKPYNKNSLNRVYSVTKSFVSIAIGFLIDEKKLSLDDKFIKFFPEKNCASEFMKNQTIRDMLTMQTSFKDSKHWIDKNLSDRTDWYFTENAANIQPPGYLFEYDSHGSYMLCVIIERITGMPFYEYLRKKCLAKLGVSDASYCLKAAGKNSWGDSAVLCTSRDLLKFASFVLNSGRTPNGEQLLSESYVKNAVSPLVFNGKTGFTNCDERGYGYQIWRMFDDCFAFVGMGEQYAVCVPEKNAVFVITSDNQGNDDARPLIMHMLYYGIIKKMSDPLCENQNAQKRLQNYIDSAELYCPKSSINPNIVHSINNKKYILYKNPMQIEYVKFNFSNDICELEYKNAQGIKHLKFGLNKNVFSKFPQTGYSDETGGVSSKNNRYSCAAGACWVESAKLFIKVQITDKYLGNLNITVSFNKNNIALKMASFAEGFLNEYNGYAAGACN